LETYSELKTCTKKQKKDQDTCKLVTDPKENFIGGQTHEWGLLFSKFK
jgi:hypothetical protein